MTKKSLPVVLAVILTFAMSATAFAATFSDAWHQDSAGNWFVQKPDGSKVTDAWLCDDAVPANGKDVWYLIDKNGNMVTAGLVQDGTGNYYSLETEHNGYFGMLRYKSGTYDGLNLTPNPNHDGSFAAITDPAQIEALKAKYGVTSVAHINNNNCVYTSSLVSGNAQAPAQTQQQTAASSNADRLHYFRMYYGMPDETEEQKQEKMLHVCLDLGHSYADMSQRPLTYAAVTKFLNATDWPNMSEMERAEACFNWIANDSSGSDDTLVKNNHGYGNGNWGQALSTAETNSGEWPIPAYHHGLCGDFASSLQSVLELVGLESKCTSIPEDNAAYVVIINHAYTDVKIDGTWYRLDPTRPGYKSSGFACNLHTIN